MCPGTEPSPRGWVLMDAGNVLWDDDEGDAFTLGNIGRELERVGRTVARGDLTAAARRAVDCYAPSVWRAVTWHFTAPDADLYQRVAARLRARWDELDDDAFRAFTRPLAGVAELLPVLRARGCVLALASNNIPRALWRLDELGFLEHFAVREVSETLGLAKPDTRFFVEILARAGADPARSVMVGDRLDCDIAPARLLGLKTVRVVRGSHREQRPRTPADLPDRSVAGADEILSAIDALLP